MWSFQPAQTPLTILNGLISLHDTILKVIVVYAYPWAIWIWYITLFLSFRPLISKKSIYRRMNNCRFWDHMEEIWCGRLLFTVSQWKPYSKNTCWAMPMLMTFLHLELEIMSPNHQFLYIAIVDMKICGFLLCHKDVKDFLLFYCK